MNDTLGTWCEQSKGNNEIPIHHYVHYPVTQCSVPNTLLPKIAGMLKCGAHVRALHVHHISTFRQFVFLHRHTAYILQNQHRYALKSILLWSWYHIWIVLHCQLPNHERIYLNALYIFQSKHLLLYIQLSYMQPITATLINNHKRGYTVYLKLS